MNTLTIDLITRIQLIFIPVWLALWDVYIVKNKAHTISSMVAYEARATTFIPLAWGILTGHFFAQWAARPYSSNDRAWLWIGAAVLVAAWDVWVHKYGAGRIVWMIRYPGAWALIGMALGFFAWGQNGPRFGS